jgi:hypothetical protein
MARADESARYREAARMTLDQLDWCVEYLRSIRKPQISRQLATNTRTLRERVDRAREETVTRQQPG